MAEDGRGVVAIGQGIEHSGCALAAAVARVGAIGGERDGAEGFQFLGGGVHQQADFPMTGVIAQGDRSAIGRADAAVGTEDEELLPAERCRVPPHAGILTPAEGISGGPLEEHFRSDRERALGPTSLGSDVEKGRVG